MIAKLLAVHLDTVQICGGGSTCATGGQRTNEWEEETYNDGSRGRRGKKRKGDVCRRLDGFWDGQASRRSWGASQPGVPVQALLPEAHGPRPGDLRLPGGRGAVRQQVLHRLQGRGEALPEAAVEVAAQLLRERRGLEGS
ncbi:unnamed protein product [Prorocentrum cordatum]|uniref:Uncharacterized protein n=1 Tax=Prorocentrum cordatum TaxID=2364126 RepID=A0ABN9R2R8_9DINO|nr:unnamed protein product [Polarella glacialis]